MYRVFKENLFHFTHNGLESLVITIGNETLIRLDFDFANKGTHLMLVDCNDFGNGNTILVFDLTARGECNSEQFIIRKLENVRINLKYSNALTETNSLILYGEFDGVLQIDANRNVVTDYLYNINSRQLHWI